MIQRRKPLKRSSKPIQRKKPVRKVSPRRAKEERVYSRDRIAFLLKPENSTCPVAAAGLIPDFSGEVRPHLRISDTIHHVWGRGKYYLDQSTWMGMSWYANVVWVENNKEESRKRGWLCDNAETKARWRETHDGLPKD